jgi:hypothetical protein
MLDILQNPHCLCKELLAASRGGARREMPKVQAAKGLSSVGYDVGPRRDYSQTEPKFGTAPWCTFVLTCKRNICTLTPY